MIAAIKRKKKRKRNVGHALHFVPSPSLAT